MRAERALLRTGEYLVGLACRRLPREMRDERCREWAAELPAILSDPQIGPAPRRAARMLRYAADTLRATARTPGQARHRSAVAPALLSGLVTIAGLVMVAWTTWDMVRAPEQWVNYARVAWSVLITAWGISQYVRATRRTSWLISISGTLAGLVVCIWGAAQAPADWVNYIPPALLSLSLLALLLVRRRARAGGQSNAGRAPAQ